MNGMRDLVRRLADDAERDGWRSAALTLLGAYPDLLQYVADERSGDWRYLLPELPKGDVLCVGGSLSPTPLALARSCASVTVQCGPAHGRFLVSRARQEGFSNITAVSVLRPSHPDLRAEYSLIAVLRSPHRTGAWRQRNLARLAKRLALGGWLYMEVDSSAISAPPRVLQTMLRHSGFSEADFFWPKPTFRHCEMLMPLGDRQVQRYYLNYQFFAMSAARRALRSILRLSTRFGLFDLTVPAYAVLARRGQGSRSVAAGSEGTI